MKDQNHTAKNIWKYHHQHTRLHRILPVSLLTNE